MDRNDERISWALDAMRLGLANELGLEPPRDASTATPTALSLSRLAAA